MASPFLVKPGTPDADGRVHAITPRSAGWAYVGFEVYDLRGRTHGDAGNGRQ